MYKPVQISIPEDKLRWEFFNDHPWELARPRVVLENDGRDHTRWNWGHSLSRPRVTLSNPETKEEAAKWDTEHVTQAARPLNGEAVVQRQQWLMQNQNLSEAAAYDTARKEFYRARHMQDIEQRVSREEALLHGGIFGMSAIEVGMQLEDKAFESFKAFATKRAKERKAVSQAAYTGVDEEDPIDTDEMDAAALEAA